MTAASHRPTIRPDMARTAPDGKRAASRGDHGSAAGSGTGSGTRASSNGKGEIRVLIVDDQRTFGEALGMALGKERDLTVVEVVTDGAAAVAASDELHPDVVLMDVTMPGMDGIEATRRIKEAEPETAVIVLTGELGDLTVGRAVQAGADGCLPKTEAVLDLAGAVRKAHAGEELLDEDRVEESLRKLRHRRQQDASIEQRLERLTPREIEILELTAAGLSSEKVSATLGMSPNTLRTHVQNVLTKLKVHSKLDAVVLALRHGAIEGTSEEMIDLSDGANTKPH